MDQVAEVGESGPEGRQDLDCATWLHPRLRLDPIAY